MCHCVSVLFVFFRLKQRALLMLDHFFHVVVSGGGAAAGIVVICYWCWYCSNMIGMYHPLVHVYVRVLGFWKGQPLNEQLNGASF